MLLLGGFLYGIISILLIIYRVHNQFEIFILGLISGMGIAFYWANRNILTIKTTHDNNRNKFLLHNSIISTTAGIIMPILVGYYISQMETIYNFSTNLVYTTLAILFLVLMMSGPIYSIFDKRLSIEVTFKKIKVKNTKLIRGIALTTIQLGLLGVVNSIIIILLVLNVIGSEFELGTIQSTLTVLSIIMMLVISKIMQNHHRLLIYNVAIACFVIAALLNMIFLNSLSVIFYIGISTLVSELIDLSTETITMKAMEVESERQNIDISILQYDREKYFAIGRIIGLLLMQGLYMYGGNSIVLRSIMLIIGLIQIPGVIFWKKINRKTFE
jgi:YQGE family putative transporter